MLHNYLIQVKFKGVKNLLCAHGRARQTQHLFSWRRISQSEIRNSAAAESEGGQKFLPPQPPSFLPARAFSLAREARRQFRSKKVRISSNKRTSIKLSEILPTDFAARSAPKAQRSGEAGRKRGVGKMNARLALAFRRRISCQ